MFSEPQSWLGVDAGGDSNTSVIGEPEPQQESQKNQTHANNQTPHLVLDEIAMSDCNQRDLTVVESTPQKPQNSIDVASSSSAVTPQEDTNLINNNTNIPTTVDKKSSSSSSSSITHNKNIDQQVANTVHVTSPSFGIDEKHSNKLHKRKNKIFTTLSIFAHHYYWILGTLLNIVALTLVIVFKVTQYAAAFSVFNILVGVLVRNELLLNVLYRLAIRSCCFKFYINRAVQTIGGAHVICSIFAVVWLCVDIGFNSSTTLFVYPFVQGVTEAIILCMLVIMIVLALPPVRTYLHNVFEFSHRYVGWSLLALLIVHVFTRNVPSGIGNIYKDPSLYMAFMLVVLVASPWFSTRLCSARIVFSTDRMVVIGLTGKPSHSGSFIRVSLNGIEWHAFAVVKITGQDPNEFFLAIASAGNWTNSLLARVKKNEAPKRMLVRKLTCPGFMFCLRSYERVICIGTGAGIAPILPCIVEKVCPYIFLVWVANSHEKNFGPAIWNTVQSLGPDNIYLHDTKVARPDIKRIIMDQVTRLNVQAVFIVSNDEFTVKVMNFCWSKGIPCYGATRDS